MAENAKAKFISIQFYWGQINKMKLSLKHTCKSQSSIVQSPRWWPLSYSVNCIHSSIRIPTVSGKKNENILNLEVTTDLPCMTRFKQNAEFVTQAASS